MKITLSHSTYEDCSVKLAKYPNGRPALSIYQDSQPILKASVNMPDHDVPDGYICIKDWSENEGILQSLIDNNIIEPPEMAIESGFVIVKICKLLITEDI